MSATSPMPTLSPGQLDEISPRIYRLVAPNANFMTGPGTNTYLFAPETPGGAWGVLDPGPLDASHVQRIINVTGGQSVAGNSFEGPIEGAQTVAGQALGSALDRARSEAPQSKVGGRTAVSPGIRLFGEQPEAVGPALPNGCRIETIAVTHTHPDHSPAARPLVEAAGAVLWGRVAPDDGRQDTTFRPDRILEEGDAVRLGATELRVLRTPGHVVNHICFLHEATGLLFTGDHMNQGTTVVITPPNGNMSDYLHSLRRLQHEPVTKIAPGHGAVIEDAQTEIRRLIAHRLQREAKVVAALQKLGGGTLDELLPAVYDDVQPFLLPVARGSLLAHLLKLRQEEKAAKGENERWQLK